MKRAFSLVPLALFSLALTAGPTPAPADPPRPAGGASKAEVDKHAAERKKALEEKIEKKKEALAEKRDQRKEALEDKRDQRKEALEDKRDELGERWRKLRETRKERRREHREEIKKAWGDLHKKPLVKAELKLHAWRMARLSRIRAIAEADGKTETVARVDKLTDKEKQRHQKRMDHLKSKGGEE